MSDEDVTCHGDHEGPCDSVWVKYSRNPEDSRRRIEMTKDGARITLEWNQGDKAGEALDALYQGIPNVLLNMALEAQLQRHVDQGVGDVEDFLRGRAGE